MASPPFVISTSIPGDSDIVSQFPGIDRTLRDVVFSWMQVDHNNNPGGHVKLTMDQTADPAAVAGKTVVSSRTDGSIVKQNSTNPVEYVGAFPGAIAYGVNTTAPAGWLLANGQAVSRTTFATLFAIIGVTYGVGDGSSTFNIPNLTDRIMVGKGTTFPTLGATGGAATHVISMAEMPFHDHGGGNHNHTFQLAQHAGIPAQTGGSGAFFSGYGTGTTDASGAIIAAQGGNATMSLMNPYITLNPFIKY